MNVDEIKDVIPITEDYGLWHPQEGIVNGYLKPSESQKIHIIGQLRQGVSKKLEDPKYAPDFITGFGVAEAVRHYYKIFKNESLEGKRAIIQGWGNVSGGAGYYLAQNGVKIVGIIDRNAGIIDTKGLSFEEVKSLILEREGNALNSEKAIPYPHADAAIWDVPADIFVPGAASRLVKKNHLERLFKGGLEVISAGANVPYADEDLFYGPTAEFADENCAVVPDFIANCGMARVFAYLMQPDVEISDQAIFEDVSATIQRGIREVFDHHPSNRYLTKHALEIALKKLS